IYVFFFFFFSSRRRHTRSKRDWSSDVCSSDLVHFIVSSGRGYNEIKSLIEAADFNSPMITLNGAEVLDENGKVLSSSPLPKITRSEERRVGKESRYRRSSEHYEINNCNIVETI